MPITRYHYTEAQLTHRLRTCYALGVATGLLLAITLYIAYTALASR